MFKQDMIWTSKFIQLVALALIVISALNYGFVGAFKVNVIERIIGKTIFTRVLYILIGLSALLMAFHRDTYLPFLGKTVFPASVLHDQTPTGATRSVTVKVTPHSKVIYWASEPSNGIEKKSYKDAYGNYDNAGVTHADHTGNAVLKVREPQSYTVPIKTLRPHVHYRQVMPYGFIGPVKSLFLSKQA